ncbi:MAG TPA: hypothetical protein VFE05_23700 [Longimicrobiaceae bacterium]|jgi:hypothetical protein|nr:hypothetical protein [Longimicrobiaceae bacterium]
MFNFLQDTAEVSVDQAAGFDRNVTMPRWGAVFSSAGYLLIFATK